MLVATAGTGGTITGIARKLKEKCPECKVSDAQGRAWRGWVVAWTSWPFSPGPELPLGEGPQRLLCTARGCVGSGVADGPGAYGLGVSSARWR